jgi:hypothetical protein
MKSFFLILGSGLLLFGCADPKYLEEKSGTPRSVEKAAGMDCSLQFSNLDLCLSFQWIETPTLDRPGRLQARIFRADPADAFPLLVQPEAALKVSLWMDSMGHGSAPVQVENTGIGTYLVSDMYFIMPGDWKIRFELMQGERPIDEIVVPYLF